MPNSEMGDESSSPPKTQPIKVTVKKPRKVFKFRFLNETNLHNVRRDQIFYYILSLHKKIRTLLRKCKRYREKIVKLVSMDWTLNPFNHSKCQWQLLWDWKLQCKIWPNWNELLVFISLFSQGASITEEFNDTGENLIECRNKRRLCSHHWCRVGSK